MKKLLMILCIIVINCTIASAACMLPGDANNDGAVSIAEVQKSINAFLGLNTCNLPTTPAGLGATVVSNTQVNLSWTAVEGDSIAGYKVYRNNNFIGSSVISGFSDVGCTAGTTYSYTVSAYDAAGNESDKSAPASATTTGGITIPAAPSGLAASAQSSTQINLSWTDNSSNETGFKIERKIGSGGNWAQIATPAANATSYNDTGLTASTTYYYRIRSTNSAGDSGYSNEVSATTQSDAATYSNASLNGVWIVSLQGDNPIYLIADGNGTITETAGINMATPAGTYQVNSNGSYTMSLNSLHDGLINVTGNLSTLVSGSVVIRSLNGTINKVSDVGLCQGNYSGTFNKSGSTYNISFSVSASGDISNFSSNIPGVTSASGKMYGIETGATLMIKTNLTTKYSQIHGWGTISSSQFNGNIQNDSNESDGTMVLTRSASSVSDVIGYWRIKSEFHSETGYVKLTQNGTSISGSFICGWSMPLNGSINQNTVNLNFTDEGCVNSINGVLTVNGIVGTVTTTKIGYCNETHPVEGWSGTKLASDPCPY